jgi:hypothetical protein
MLILILTGKELGAEAQLAVEGRSVDIAGSSANPDFDIRSPYGPVTSPSDQYFRSKTHANCPPVV